MRTLLTLFVVSTLLAACGGLGSNSGESEQTDRLPILGRKQVKSVEEAGATRVDTIYHTISDFSFLNQDSVMVTPATFDDRIYISDFFFTSCPTICPKMKEQMLRVYQRFQDNDEFMILSHTIDPEYDTVGLLRDYAARLGVSSSTWHFVTGEKKDIYKIGQTSYMVTATEDPAEPGGFLHSGAFILVDKEKRIRGIYDGTKPDQVDILMEDIEKLLDEYSK